MPWSRQAWRGAKSQLELFEPRHRVGSETSVPTLDRGDLQPKLGVCK